MKKIYFLLLLCVPPISVKGQEIFEIKFTAGITQYRGALVLWENGTGKMRVRYYADGQKKIIEQEIRTENTQHGLRLTGYNAVYAGTNVKASYNPDNFYISQDENGNIICTNIDDGGVSASASIRIVTGYSAKQSFLRDFNWRL